jgi:hypothetical protein
VLKHPADQLVLFACERAVNTYCPTFFHFISQVPLSLADLLGQGDDGALRAAG